MIATLIALLTIWYPLHQYPYSDENGYPIPNIDVCLSQYSRDLQRCRIAHPDTMSLEYQVCASAAGGRYEGCLDSMDGR